MQVFTKVKSTLYFLLLLLFVIAGWPVAKAMTVLQDENDAPTISGLPSDVTVEEDSQDNVFDISSATIADVDAGSGELTLTLQATGGVFNIATDPGITITGHLTGSLTLTGNLTNLNHYINFPSNIWFVPDHNLYGNDAAVVKVFINDNGNTGSGGGTNVFIGNVNVDITAVNDAPEVSLPATIEVTEDANSALSGISFTDVDAESGGLAVTFNVAAGTLSATSGGGVTTTGSGTGSLTLNGTLADLNAFLSGSNVTFLNQPGNTNDQTLAVSVHDNGNTGGGNMTAAGSAVITVLPATTIIPGDPGNFITTWKTDNPGDSQPNQIAIPIHQDGGYNFTIAWGDGSQTSWQDGDDPQELTHTYAAPGTYTVEITGDFPRIYFDGSEDRQKILTIEQWGDIAWSSMEDAFDGAINLMGNATDAPDLSGVTSLARMFWSASAFNGNISSWDVSGITNMSGMFTGASNFNQDIGGWNVANVTNMDGMFVNAYAFNQDISSWQVGNVTNMNSMFRNAVKFNQDISGWDVSKVTIMQRMLFNTSVFNVNIGNWDVSNVTDMFEMLSQSGLSLDNYDATLIGWAAQAVQDGITLGADGLEYCASAGERQSLIDDHGWTISGDTQSADCEGDLNPDANNILYVNINVNTGAAGYTGDGSSWNNAVPELADALHWARQQDLNGSGWTQEEPLQIWVADGTYYPDEGASQTENDRSATFQLVNSVEIYGGFAGVETILTQRDWAINLTTLDGDIDQDGTIANNAYHVVTGSNTNTTPVLNGFTITGGNANGSSEKNGGGMYNFGGSSTLTNLIFKDNRADQDGGGIFNSGSSSVLRNLVFTGNQSDRGAGLFGQVSMLQLINATFYGNTAGTAGGAITSGWNGTLELTNVLIWGNEAEGSSTSASASIDSRGGGITVSNSLVANSGGSSSWNIGMGADGGNNTDADPEFVSTTPGQAGYLQPGATSPVVNGGSNNAYSDTGGDLENDMDLAGNPRVAGDIIDMGAYEYQGETVYIKQLTMPDTVQVAYGTALEDVTGLPTDVMATLSDDTDVSVPVDDNLANWTLISPADSAYNGEMAGSYLFSVPLLIPQEAYYSNADSLQAEVTITVAKGTPVLTASWNDVAIDQQEGLALTYSDRGQLVFSTTDTDGEITYAFGDGDTPVLDLADLSAVRAQQAGTATLTLQQAETANFEAATLSFTVSVTPGTITLVPETGQAKIYGEDDPGEYGYTLAEGFELAEGDMLSEIISGSSREEGEDTGTYDIILTFEGVKAANYDITFEEDNNAFAITPLAITVTADDKSKVYRANDPELTYTTDPLIGDDTFTGMLEREAGEVVGTYRITQGTLTAGNNYAITFEEGTLTITAADYENIAFNDGEFTYDGTTHTLAITGELPEGASVTYLNNGRTDAGTQTVRAQIDGGQNYEDMSLEAELTVTPLGITVAAENKTKVYGAVDPALTYTFAPELISEDSFTGSLSREPGENAGTYAITQGTLTAGNNYAITFDPGTLTITQGGYEDIAFNNASFTYDGTEHHLAITGELPEGATVSYENNGLSDAGSVTVTAMIDGGDNYENMSLEAELTVKPLPITVAAENKTKVYSTPDPALTYTTVPELIGGDAFAGSLARGEGENVGKYAITQGSLTAGANYDITFAGADFEITPANLTGISFSGESFTYDGTEHQLAISGDLPEGATVSYESNGRRNVGEQMVRAQIDGGVNYSDLSLEAELRVTPLAITVTAENKTKTFGEADPALSFAVAPQLISDDSFTGSLSREPGENAGSYAITRGDLTAGDNYTINFIPGTLTVMPGKRSLIFAMLAPKTYGDPNFDPGAKVTGSNEDVIYSSSNPGVAEIIEGEIRITGAGTAEITATLPENPNYEDTPLIIRQLIVRKAPQSIDFAPIGEVFRDAGIISLDVFTSSGLPVTLSSSDQQVAVVAGEIELEILRLGSSQITATQAGNGNYLPAEPVSRELKVTDPDNKLVKVHPVVSPNSDGINEFLLIEGIRDYPENRLTIVNRNGVRVFEMKGYDNGSRAFRGLSNTVTNYDFLPQGTYFYLVEIRTSSGWKKETGWFVMKFTAN